MFGVFFLHEYHQKLQQLQRRRQLRGFRQHPLVRSHRFRKRIGQTRQQLHPFARRQIFHFRILQHRHRRLILHQKRRHHRPRDFVYAAAGQRMGRAQLVPVVALHLGLIAPAAGGAERYAA